LATATRPKTIGKQFPIYRFLKTLTLPISALKLELKFKRKTFTWSVGINVCVVGKS
jgi:hypothetical protein